MIFKNYYADYLSVYCIIRQDLQDFQDFFAFPEERQKPISLFEGVHLNIKAEQKSDMNVQQQYHRLFWRSFPAESGMIFSRFRLETEKAINPINPVNPV